MADGFGAYRVTPKKGHKHAGIDLKGKWEEQVFPIAEGSVLFRSYCHSIQLWSSNTNSKRKQFMQNTFTLSLLLFMLGILSIHKFLSGQLLSQEEFKQSRYPYNHLHLEIRKDYSDFGKASSYSMTMNALKRCCHDPLVFFEEGLKQ